MIRVVTSLVGLLLLVLGLIAMGQNADATLRVLPAMLLPITRPLSAGPDIPGHLTTSGILAVYIVPGIILLVLGTFPGWRRRVPQPAESAAPNGEL
jgi:hypothetical protein